MSGLVLFYLGNAGVSIPGSLMDVSLCQALSLSLSLSLPLSLSLSLSLPLALALSLSISLSLHLSDQQTLSLYGYFSRIWFLLPSVYTLEAVLALNINKLIMDYY